MKKEEFTLYRGLLGDIKSRVRQAQQRAAHSANAEMLLMYWDIGRMIDSRREQEGWGSGVIPRLAADLKNELPEQKGFSESNIKRMVRFWEAYPQLFSVRPLAVVQIEPTEGPNAIGPRAVAQLPSPGGSPGLPSKISSADSSVQQAVLQLSWAHNVILLEKIKAFPTRLWYANQTLDQGWTRDTLAAQIKSNAHDRQGKAVNNFNATLPAAQASLARQLLKDPYIFDFLTLEAPFRERELESGLLTHLQKFLVELGRGFAFVGRQYRIEVADKEYFLDLLFYHLHLRCFVVVDLKTGEFQPEFAGKMNFYCSVVDDQLRHAADQVTLGLILCQSRDRVIAEYALRSIHKPIGVADYELTRALPKELASSLPSIEEIEAELSQGLKDEDAGK